MKKYLFFFIVFCLGFSLQGQERKVTTRQGTEQKSAQKAEKQTNENKQGTFGTNVSRSVAEERRAITEARIAEARERTKAEPNTSAIDERKAIIEAKKEEAKARTDLEARVNERKPKPRDIESNRPGLNEGENK